MSQTAARNARDLLLADRTRLASAAFAALLGAFVLYGVALSPIEALHAAAHDARHSIAAPCH